LGHHVVCASSGDAALQALKENPDLDLVITDQAMPKMTGLQLREAIRKTRPRLPVIIATGYAEMPASASGDVLRLAKPFSQDELMTAVIDAILGEGVDGRSGARDTRPPAVH